MVSQIGTGTGTQMLAREFICVVDSNQNDLNPAARNILSSWDRILSRLKYFLKLVLKNFKKNVKVNLQITLKTSTYINNVFIKKQFFMYSYRYLCFMFVFYFMKKNCTGS